jgi:hypothetical protein
MLASRTVFSSVARIDRLHPTLPLALETVVGGALEMAIHSIEGLRDRIVRRALLRAMRALAPAPTA